MRGKLTRKGLRELMKELSRSAPGRRTYRVYLVRGFRQDLLDAEKFLSSGMVDAERFRRLVHQIAESAYSRYPALSRQAVLDAVHDYLT